MATNSHAATIAATLARVLGKKGYGAEVQRRYADAQAQQERDSHKLLAPTDVAGEYDTKRLLMTTLGGQIRPLSRDDLRTFADSAKKLGKKFKGGITARGVVDLSLQVDRDRANREIRMAVVVKAQLGMMHFVTNSGPDSDVTRHHVHVEFPAFKAYAAQGQKPDKLARTMLDGPLKWSCDCGRERFWYAYIMTIGGFKSGPQQPNFPKIRNPNLAGVGCKHALRVMQGVMKDANVKAQATKMLATAQRSDNKAQTLTAAEAQEIARKQLAQSHHVKNLAETSKQIAARQAKSPAGKIKAMKAAIAESKRRSKALKSDFRKLERHMANGIPLTKAMKAQLERWLATAKTID